MKSIVTLTLNPALDISSSVEQVVAEHKLRCGPASFDAGGGGVNVARVVKRLGGSATPVYAIGGPLANAYKELLKEEGIDGHPILINGSTRSNITIDERSTGDQYRFVFAGPEFSKSEWNRTLEILPKLLAPGDFLVASGSLPPGLPDDFYARVARLAKTAGALFIADTSGAPLREALKERVYLVKPNLREMEELVNAELSSKEDQEQAALAIIEQGQSEIVALTLGANGALVASADGIIWADPLKVKILSAVGAGDSFLAAFILCLAQDRSLPDALRYAMAAGAAALMTPASDLCRKEDVEELFKQQKGALIKERAIDSLLIKRVRNPTIKLSGCMTQS